MTRPILSWWPVLAVLLVLGCHDEQGCHLASPDRTFGTAVWGEACEQADDCVRGLVCAGDGICRNPGEPGTADVGEDCVSTDFCRAGLACASNGTCAGEGDPGTADFGETCDTTGDCRLGFACEEGACHGFEIPLWNGAECADPDADTGPPRVFFEVPAGEPLADFYRLPFPNDARVQDRLDLSDHPTPGVLIPDLGDVAAEVIATLEEDFTGFGNNQAAFFRFSAEIDYDTLVWGLPQDDGTWGVVDLTPGPTFGELQGGGYRASTGRGRYICHNWLAMFPSDGRPYEPGHVYAAYLTRGVLPAAGGTLAQDADFSAMLAGVAPPELGPAWEAYRPLRDWLAVSGADLAAAAVFTVQDPTAPLEALRDAVLAAPAPSHAGLHACAGADPGPYDGCEGAPVGFHEVHGTVTLPQFQVGTPPFKEPDDGGAIDFASGPTVQRTEGVVFALTVPDAPMPTGGWPLVLYGHGTGGHYRSFVEEGLADVLSDVALDDGTHVRFAVLSIDAVAHGGRRHPESWDERWLELDPGAYDPDVLFFNPLNPRATRDNPLQAAADGWALVRWATALDLSAGSSPTGEAIRFDPGELYYLGHSQGATTGVGFVATEPAVQAAVFSGAGGLLIESLIAKERPLDIPAALRIGLADPDLDRAHPLLNLVQAAAERADPVNHAGAVHAAPRGSNPRRHVLQTYGIGDGFTPDATQRALVRALRLEQAPNGHAPLDDVTQVSAPVSGNQAGITAVTVLYAGTSGGDPHYVLFDRVDARRQASHFLGTAVRDGVPTVVAP